MAVGLGVKAVMLEDPDYLSEESDFYGDETTKLELEARANEFDVKEWWENKGRTLMDVAEEQIELDALAVKSVSSTLSNPYEGVVCGRQLSETVDEFLKRLPPATTPATDGSPWIYIANPYRKAPKRATYHSNLAEEEAPPDEDSQWAELVRVGSNLLHELTSLRHDIEKKNPSKAKATITKAVNKERDEIVKKLLATAADLHCTSGKWMIFCPPHEVNEVWAAIARATANNDLGIAAKVAPDAGEDRKERLICIYTKDFTDVGDVARVLAKLKELGLVESKGRGIFYKCDAYTYLGLISSNDYNIKASMYSSTELFKLGKAKDVKVDGFFNPKKKDDGDRKTLD